MWKQTILRRLRQLGLVFGVWSTLALIPAIQAHQYIASLGHAITWKQALLPVLITHWIWAALTPGVLWLSSRYPIERRAWARVIAIHLLGSFAFAVLHVTIRCPLIPSATLYTTRPGHISWALLRNSMFANYYDDLWIYSTIVAVSQVWNYYRKYRARELRATKLEAQLAQAQLQVLKMQLNPHFLFNTLHAISSLMHEDVEAADDMVTGLSDLLRMSLDNVNEQEVKLKREMEFVEVYLAIQQIRFRDRLTVRLDVDPVSLDALVPNMILQPLIENAVTHGIASRPGNGEIQIRARRQDGVLRLEVCDNGRGLAGNPTEMRMKGLGISNTQARLQQLYGPTHRFELVEAPGGGTVVKLELPFRVSRNIRVKEEPRENPSHHRG